MSKPSLPQGTRDFSPATVRKRTYILNTLRTVFELYGFQPLETPAFENLETLMGKYGEEGDKLIFRILNNGLSDPKNSDKAKAAFEKVLLGKNDRDLTERALRYDLTIPFARYVAMNHGQLSFPFKRYQIQPVWRADRPQRGRYREFYQCDADTVGSQSMLNELEFVQLYREAFKRLGLNNAQLRINSRKVLAALAEVCGGAEKLSDITIAIDKLDKIGMEKVEAELLTRGLDAQQVKTIREYLVIDGTNEEKIVKAQKLLGENSVGRKGIDEIRFILAHQDRNSTTVPVTVDLTLARGLNYYTGIIFEAKAPAQVVIGSIGGGGRYDDLTGLFGVPGIPGVGISFGVDRIYDVMEELGLFPEEISTSTQVLIINREEADVPLLLRALSSLRERAIRSELYPETVKSDKQYRYAEKKNIPFVIHWIANEELFHVKDIRTGVSEKVSLGRLGSLNFS